MPPGALSRSTDAAARRCGCGRSQLAGGRSTLVFPAPDRLAEMVVEYWYPAAGQLPDGLSTKAWFRVVEGWGFRTEHSPRGSVKGSVLPDHRRPCVPDAVDAQ